MYNIRRAKRSAGVCEAEKFSAEEGVRQENVAPQPPMTSCLPQVFANRKGVASLVERVHPAPTPSSTTGTGTHLFPSFPAAGLFSERTSSRLVVGA